MIMSCTVILPRKKNRKIFSKQKQYQNVETKHFVGISIAKGILSIYILSGGKLMGWDTAVRSNMTHNIFKKKYLLSLPLFQFNKF